MSTSLMSRLRAAASRAAETTVEHGRGDPAELVALAEEIGAREGCAAECSAPPGRPGVLAVRFTRLPRPS